MNFNHSLRTWTEDRRSFWEVWGSFDTHLTEVNGWSVGWVRLATCLTKPLREKQRCMRRSKVHVCLSGCICCVCGKQKFAAMDVFASRRDTLQWKSNGKHSTQEAIQTNKQTLLIHHTQHNCVAQLSHNLETSLQLQSFSGISQLLGQFHTTSTSSMQEKQQHDCNSRFPCFHTDRVSSRCHLH